MGVSTSKGLRRPRASFSSWTCGRRGSTTSSCVGQARLGWPGEGQWGHCGFCGGSQTREGLPARSDSSCRRKAGTSFKMTLGISLVVRWLGICLSVQGADPWSGRIPHTKGQLSPCVVTTETRVPRARAPHKGSHHNEKPVHHNEE